ncbi:DUF2207 domain-containing protein [Bifidobacterium cuniculi]|uniref:DUF2207 domain-containing protein n=1 Tax=Bifidobacterium cuniculi TaxID=1688 RepID=A0A087AY74_9BIFI|nr:DUF2207 domain-containing protein [Bifidobacterium cuniculi]KFI63724.1 hypothetical protein BCUN_1206 [Bifidobacterium cuniculi]
MRPRSITKAVIVALVATAVLFVCMAAPIMAATKSASGSYRTWDIEAQVTKDGDIVTRQVIDAHLNHREDGDDNTVPWRQAYRQYTLESWQVTGLSDISVKNLNTGETYTQMDPTCSSPSAYSSARWDAQCAGHWYIADVSYGASNPRPYEPLTPTETEDDGTSTTVEVGWNFPSVSSVDSLRFEVTMTFENAVTAYGDVDAFQWSVRNDEDEVPIGELNVTLALPEGTGNDTSWAWLHTEALSENSRSDDGRVLRFSARDLRAGQYVDVVAMFNPTSAVRPDRRVSGDVRQSLYDTEEAKQRAWNEQRHHDAVIKVTIWTVIALVGAALCVGALVMAMRRRKNATYRGPIEYWRDLPQMSPGAAAKLASVVAPEQGTDWATNAMTATVMSLMSKGAVGIYPGAAARYRGIDMSRPDMVSLAQMIDMQGGGENTSTIVIMPVVFTPQLPELALCESEQAALDLLIKASQRIGSPVFDLDQMNACFKDDETAYKDRAAFTDAAMGEYRALGATKSAAGSKVMGMLACVLAVLSGMVYAALGGGIALMLCISAPMMFLGALALGLTPATVLSSPDNVYAGEVIGLKRYLEDYSDFSDRGVLDMTLWGRYMVYAAAFGISDKAIAQLVRAYPQVADPRWLDDSAVGYGLVYWSLRPARHHYGGAFSGTAPAGMFSAHGGSFGSQLSDSFSSISSTITAAMPSSSGSSGGGFSGGGFGGGGGGGGGSSGGFR